jgi:hypothetical protein
VAGVPFRELDAEADATRFRRQVAIRRDEAKPVGPWLVADRLEVRRARSAGTSAPTHDLLRTNCKPRASQSTADSTRADVEVERDGL